MYCVAEKFIIWVFSIVSDHTLLRDIRIIKLNLINLCLKTLF